jgi:tRNA-dihydrouridine synthase B
MVARGAFGNPWLFEQGNAVWPERRHPRCRRLPSGWRQRSGRCAPPRYKGEKIAILEARKQLCWYLRGVAHAGTYKQDITGMNTLADAERIIRAVQMNLR